MKLSELTPTELVRLSRDAADFSRAMTAALLPGAVWQPVETAPRDGTLILLLLEDGQPRGAYWTENRVSAISPGYDGYSGPGWADAENGWVDFESRGIKGWLLFLVGEEVVFRLDRRYYLALTWFVDRPTFGE